MVTKFMQRLPIILGGIASYVLIEQALRKMFFNRPNMVAAFGGMGLPAPELMVWFLGIVELLGALAFLTGFGGRIMAVVVGIEMLVAMNLTVRNQNNTVVFLCCLAILLLGTGPHSLWDPFRRFTPRFLADRRD